MERKRVVGGGEGVGFAPPGLRKHPVNGSLIGDAKDVCTPLYQYAFIECKHDTTVN